MDVEALFRAGDVPGAVVVHAHVAVEHHVVDALDVGIAALMIVTGNHGQHLAAFFQHGAHGRGVLDVVILRVHAVERLMAEHEHGLVGLAEIGLEPFHLLRRNDGVHPGPEGVFRGVHVVGTELAGRVVGVEHDAVNAARVVGVVGFALLDAGVGHAGKEGFSFEIVEVMVAEHVIGGAAERGEQGFYFAEVGGGIGARGEGVHEVAELDDEGGLFLLHGVDEDFHLVHGGGVHAGGAVGLGGSVHVGDDAGLEQTLFVLGFGGGGSGQNAGGGAGRGGHTHLQNVAAGNVVCHALSPVIDVVVLYDEIFCFNFKRRRPSGGPGRRVLQSDLLSGVRRASASQDL